LRQNPPSLPDWVYERDYLLDKILANTVDGSFSYYDYKQIQKKKFDKNKDNDEGAKNENDDNVIARQATRICLT
jgi:hypothetical protein